MQEDVNIYKRALERERQARKAAEKILEQKSSELFNLSLELKKSNDKLLEILGEQNSELQGLFKNLVDAYVVFDFKGQVLRMNDAATKLVGRKLSDEPLWVNGIIAPEDKKRTFTAFNQLKRKGTVTNLKFNIDTPHGGRRLILVNLSVIRDIKETPIAAQGIIRDITKEQEAKSNLLESQKRLKSLIINLQAGILLEDENRKIVFTNKMFCEMFSIPADPESLKGMDCTRSAEDVKHFFTEPDAFVARISKLVNARKTTLGDELHLIDGRILQRDYVPIFVNKVYKGHLWSYTDITIKKKFEYGLQVQKQKYSNIIADMNLGLVEMDNENNIQWANDTFCNITQFALCELLSKNINDLCKHENDETVIDLAVAKEIEIHTREGEIKNLLCSQTPNRDITGAIKGMIGTFLDITHIKSLEKEKERLLVNLEQSNQQLSEYAHIVSHDLKSPLRSLQALISWVREDEADKLSIESVQNFDLMENTLVKMENLISGILNYSNIQSAGRNDKPINLNTVIEDLRQILYIPEHIKLIQKKELPTIVADNTRMQQLFQNLISNAIDHIDKPFGEIVIDVTEDTTEYIFTVADNGVGISKVYHEKIFKMFQSLSEQKKSTGLGLSIVKKIVEMYGGKIWLESEKGIGTTFYFSIARS